jgi:hypothetical protein
MDQIVNGIYHARGNGHDDFDLKDLFSEFSGSKSDRRKAFAWLGFGKTVKGNLNLSDGGKPLMGAVISIQLNENFSLIPVYPSAGPYQPNDASYIRYTYYFTESNRNPALTIKVNTPSQSAADRFNTFIWGR